MTSRPRGNAGDRPRGPGKGRGPPMLKRFALGLASPGFMLLWGAVAVGYVAQHPAREATAHERYLRDRDPLLSTEEELARTRPHRAACPTCRAADAFATLCRAHHGAEFHRVMDDLSVRSERPIDHVRRCPACQAQPIP